MKKILFVAPHPDDETLGCGGTIFKHLNQGDEVHWLILTTTTGSDSFSKEFTNKRDEEIRKVSELYKFKSTTQLDFKTTELDSYPLKELIDTIKKEIEKVDPECMYVPFYGDPHSDHRISFEVIEAVSKKFRLVNLKSIRAYETLSETGFSLYRENFKPNLWVDITDTFEKKLEVMKVYQSEVSEHPFPRSSKSIEALATLRGAEANCFFAESFMVLKDYQ